MRLLLCKLLLIVVLSANRVVIEEALDFFWNCLCGFALWMIFPGAMTLTLGIILYAAAMAVYSRLPQGCKPRIAVIMRFWTAGQSRLLASMERRLEKLGYLYPTGVH